MKATPIRPGAYRVTGHGLNMTIIASNGAAAIVIAIDIIRELEALST